MTKYPSIDWGDRRGYLAVVILSLGAIGCTGLLSFSSNPVFQPFFRDIPPVFAVSVISVLGVVSLGSLSSCGWFELQSKGGSLTGVAWSTAFATLFVVVIVLVDLVIVFPYQHVPPPQSLLFYPTIAYVAEIVFHILPLATLLALLGPMCTNWDSSKLLWVCIILASCPEPIFHMSWRSSESTRLWVDVYVALHVFAFNVLQLALFRRYDFVSMYVCRLTYYLEWHIVWGYARQSVLPVS